MIVTEPVSALCGRLGWDFADPGLLERALAHRSWCAEHPGTVSNERLEFLGDAVLGLVITDELVHRHPERSEGWMSRARSELVRSGTLYAVALELSLGDHIRLGKGEELTGGRSKPSILADAVEALIGAVYLDAGIDAARGVIAKQFAARLARQAGDGAGDGSPAPADAKSRLQEWCARDGGPVPTYTWTESGPEHDKTFVVEAVVAGTVLATGTGRSKKQAEQDAAAHALALFVADPDPSEPPVSELLASNRESLNEVSSG